MPPPSKPSTLDDYTILKKLGQGTYGSVYLCTANLHADKPCVMKRMLLRNLSDRERDSAIQEAELLSSLNHPNIVAYVDTILQKHKLYLVMQYCDGGDLERRLAAARKRESALDEAQLLDWFVQMALALQYLHSRRIIHRDLKTANVFLTGIGIVKLGDFGVSRVLSATQELAKTFVGTPYYLSPELLNNSPYGAASDVWALGVIFHEMCTLRHPYEAKSFPALAHKILSEPPPPLPPHREHGAYVELQELAHAMLRKEPDERPRIADLLEYPVVQRRMQQFVREAREQASPQLAVGGVTSEGSELSSPSGDGTPPEAAPPPQQCTSARDSASSSSTSPQRVSLAPGASQSSNSCNHSDDADSAPLRQTRGRKMPQRARGPPPSAPSPQPVVPDGVCATPSSFCPVPPPRAPALQPPAPRPAWVVSGGAAAAPPLMSAADVERRERELRAEIEQLRVAKEQLRATERASSSALVSARPARMGPLPAALPPAHATAVAPSAPGTGATAAPAPGDDAQEEALPTFPQRSLQEWSAYFPDGAPLDQPPRPPQLGRGPSAQNGSTAPVSAPVLGRSATSGSPPPPIVRELSPASLGGTDYYDDDSFEEDEVEDATDLLVASYHSEPPDPSMASYRSEPAGVCSEPDVSVVRLDGSSGSNSTALADEAAACMGTASQGASSRASTLDATATHLEAAWIESRPPPAMGADSTLRDGMPLEGVGAQRGASEVISSSGSQCLFASAASAASLQALEQEVVQLRVLVAAESASHG